MLPASSPIAPALSRVMVLSGTWYGVDSYRNLVPLLNTGGMAVRGAVSRVAVPGEPTPQPRAS